MAQKLFEYAVIFRPKAQKDNSGNDTTPNPEIIVPVTAVLAEDEAQVRLRAARAVSTDYDNKLDQIQVVVRPFN